MRPSRSEREDTKRNWAMIINDVLDLKGHRVETVLPWRPLDDIPRLFVDRNIASVVVVEAAGKPIGIVTDRLLISALAKRGTETMDLTAKDVMQAPPPSCAPTDSVAHVLDVMTEKRVRHMLVMADAKMVGIVSIGDLVKYRLRDADMETRILRDAAIRSRWPS
jgi:CBS domain-containing protein